VEFFLEVGLWFNVDNNDGIFALQLRFNQNINLSFFTFDNVSKYLLIKKSDLGKIDICILFGEEGYSLIQ